MCSIYYRIHLKSPTIQTKDNHNRRKSKTADYLYDMYMANAIADAMAKL
jgi:hypothetical protein